MEPKYTTFEQAKWLKEKGFDGKTRYNFDLNGEVHHVGLLNHNESEKKISRPEQWQVIEWLRVNHGIWVSVDLVLENKWFYSIKKFNYMGYEVLQSGHLNSKHSCTPQEAYSSSFDYIKNNNLI